MAPPSSLLVDFLEELAFTPELLALVVLPNNRDADIFSWYCKGLDIPSALRPSGAAGRRRRWMSFPYLKGRSGSVIDIVTSFEVNQVRGTFYDIAWMADVDLWPDSGSAREMSQVVARVSQHYFSTHS